MSKNYIEYVKHIRDECSFILSVITADKPKEEFIADETLKRAIVRSLEIIGEASKKIPGEEKLKWKEIKSPGWGFFIEMINKLA